MISDESELTRSISPSTSRILYTRLRATFDWSGVALISIECLILELAFGPGAALLLFLVGLLVTGASFLRQNRELNDSPVEEMERSWKNAIANAGIATVLGGLTILRIAPNLRSLFAVAAVASLAAALSDSLSHELGVLYGGKPRLITTWRQVEPGENGAITLTGCAIGLVSAIAIALLAVLLGVILQGSTLVVVLAACFGNLTDTILGAIVQRRGWLSNNDVNLGAVFSASAVVLLTFAIFGFA